MTPLAYMGRYASTRPGLERIAALLHRLDNPQHTLRFIHIAGTNGKGSTACFLANILRAAGLRTGLFTSPPIHRFHEQLQINGAAISDEALAKTMARIRPHADALADHPSAFELTTAAAFCWFAEAGCELVVLEAGLGGALDATNVIAAPEIAVITPISIDHMEYLGTTLAEIAQAETGILKPGATVVTAPQPPEAAAVLAEAAQQCGAPLRTLCPDKIVPGSFSFEGQRFCYDGGPELHIRLLGRYQLENAALALMAAEALAQRGWAISTEAMRQGLAEAQWPGRFQLASPALPGAPKNAVIVDGGHNAQGAQVLADNLRRYFPGQQIIFVMGVLADKDLPGLLAPLLPLAQRCYTVTPDSPRALSADCLAAALAQAGVSAEAVPEGVAQALALAQKAAGATDVVCYFGSLYSVGEALRALGFL